jgi:uncharacterized repeat protein (TIGR03803 family)
VVKLLAVCFLAAPSGVRAANYKVFYVFQGATGSNLHGKLAARGDALYGASGGGGGDCNCGFLFRLGANGAYEVLHSFAGGDSDGAYPEGGMALVGNELFGATSQGGATGCEYGSCGTIYDIDPDDKVHQLYEFVPPIGNPSTDLTASGGAIWGAGFFMGGVFKITPTAQETYYPLDILPNGPLLAVGNELYGATYVTGQFCQRGDTNCGSLYGVSRKTGQMSTLYNFTGGTDGAFPSGSLAHLHNAFYGTNPYVVYKVVPPGNETTLHSFAGGQDGASPNGLVEFEGKLYGTTQAGGTSGFGTIFSVTQGGVYKILHSFAGGADGGAPYGQLTVWRNALYGTTSEGGGTGCGGGGCGTVFRLKP